MQSDDHSRQHRNRHDTWSRRIITTQPRARGAPFSNTGINEEGVSQMRRYSPTRTIGFTLTLAATLIIFKHDTPASACGGFFCQLVPINQAGEQIIFRQDGNQVTAVVLIQYAGDAEDFSWVVPVPGVPEVSVGSDLVFSTLEPATRPQFILDVNGEPCAQFFGPVNAVNDALAEEAGDDGAVEVLAAFAVGPFDVEVVSSEDAEALATWLEENDYDLTDRGVDLIRPYVEEGMNFVAVKLQKDQGVGDIQPLILKYKSDNPMIPIRLTAVAAQPDMGVIAWVLGSARAVPSNYLHVEPNYTRLDWFSGTLNAYANYQTLITEAMNEAGGQGFATDYAGRDLDVIGLLPSASDLESEITALQAAGTDEFFDRLLFSAFIPQSKSLEILGRELPVSDDVGQSVYFNTPVLREIFGEDRLSAATVNIIAELNTTVVEPFARTVEVFDGDLYMTRLYTTLSADEMTLDPEFVFNPDLGDQPLERRATLDIRCDGSVSHWELTLGAGTERVGELVIRGQGESPLFNTPPVIEQPAISRSGRVASSGPIEFDTVNTFQLAQVGDGENGNEPGNMGNDLIINNGLGSLFGSLCGAGMGMVTLMSFTGLWLMGLRRR